MTTKQWAVRKWEWIVKNWDYEDWECENGRRLVQAIPKLQDFLSECSYCQKYYPACSKCSLHDRGADCCKEYYKWLVSVANNNKRWGNYWAKKMLAKIEEL